MRLRKLTVFDRLLARLLMAAPDQWSLKGDVALDFRLGDRARTTKDLDLSRRDDIEATTSSMIDATRVQLDDFFTFSIERIGLIDLDLSQPTVRYRATAELGGRLFDQVIVDVGFGDLWPIAPDVLSGPDILSFAGVSPIRVPPLPLEMHLAEKIHAYTRMYEGGRYSSRVKDLIDIVLIGSSAEFQSIRVRQTVVATFNHRRGHELPGAIPAPSESWIVPYRRLAEELHLDPDLRLGYRFAATFLDPILAGNHDPDAHWNPVMGSWSLDSRP